MPRISAACQNDWTPELIGDYYKILEDIAVGEWGYDIYKNQIEIVSSEGMLEAYASTGLPIMYPHWSFGKAFLQNQRDYRRGAMGLAYEMIINSDPCIQYLLEENTMTMQVLVLAHAGIGHNHFFKNNYLFRQWTMADYIIDYLGFAKRLVENYEDRYGYDAVEEVLDAAHALSTYSVDKYQKRKKRKRDAENQRIQRLKWDEANYDPLLMREFLSKVDDNPEDDPDFEETENVLYFIEKNAPNLKDWERELVRMVRKINQYFYPQRFTQLMNEGCATFTHHTLVEELDKRGHVDEAFMLEFCHAHSGVIYQPDYNSKHWNGRFNPYNLGQAMFDDMRRICETPTKEDEQWFPYLAGQPFWPEFFRAVANFKDESFILQYLSPKLIRDKRMFAVYDSGPNSDTYKVSAIHDEEGYRKIREAMSKDWDTNVITPQVSVHDVSWKQDRRLILRHQMYRNRPLNSKEAEQVLVQLHRLWQFPVEVHSVDRDGVQRAKHLYQGD